MKRYPHKPDEKLLAQFRQAERENYESRESLCAQARADRNARFFKGRGDNAMDVACLEYAFDAPAAEVMALLDAAAELAAASVEFGIALDPTLYMTYLALANLCARDEFRKKLEGFTRQQFTNENIKADEIFYLAAEALAAISSGQLGRAEKLAGQALARLQGGDVNHYAREAMGPVLLIEQAIAQKDRAKLQTAIRARHEQYAKSYSRAAVKNYPSGLLDVLGLGLLKLARRNGLAVEAQSVYLPGELLER